MTEEFRRRRLVKQLAENPLDEEQLGSQHEKNQFEDKSKKNRPLTREGNQTQLGVDMRKMPDYAGIELFSPHPEDSLA